MVEYNVPWRGFTASDTWEPRSSFLGDAAKAEYREWDARAKKDEQKAAAAAKVAAKVATKQAAARAVQLQVIAATAAVATVRGKLLPELLKATHKRVARVKMVGNSLDSGRRWIHPSWCRIARVPAICVEIGQAGASPLCPPPLAPLP